MTEPEFSTTAVTSKTPHHRAQRPAQIPGQDVSTGAAALRRLHGRFHGRWSGLKFAVGAAVNLGGLIGLGRLALGA